MAHREDRLGPHVGKARNEGLGQRRVVLDHRHDGAGLAAEAVGEVVGDGVGDAVAAGGGRDGLVAVGTAEPELLRDRPLGALRRPCAQDLGDDLVDGIGGHVAVGRELAARDRDDAARGAVDVVATGEIGGPARRCGLHERTQAGPGADDVVTGDRVDVVGVDRGQEVVDVVLGALRIVDAAVVVGVGGADVGELAVGHDEHRAAVLGDRDDRGDGVAHEVVGDREVHPLGRPHRVGVGALVEGADPVGPDAGGVDDGVGRDGELVTVGGDGDPVDVAGGALGEAGHRDPVGHHRAVVQRCGAADGDNETGVVGGGVEVEVAADQVLGGQRRHVLERLGLGDPLVELADLEPAGDVVAPHGGAEQAGDLGGDHAALAEHGQEKGEELHEVRRIGEEALTLGEGFVDELDVALLQVTEPAVNELGRLGRRARGEVVAFDERHLETTRRGIERDAGAGDATADDNEVEGLVAEAIEGRGAFECCESHAPMLPRGNNAVRSRTRAAWHSSRCDVIHDRKHGVNALQPHGGNCPPQLIGQGTERPARIESQWTGTGSGVPRAAVWIPPSFTPQPTKKPTPPRRSAANAR